MMVENKLRQCLREVQGKISFVPQVAVVLGSGLGDFAESVQEAVTLPYGEIGGFPLSTAPGHKGRFVFGVIEGVNVVVMQGRVHYYEGYDMGDVVLPIRLMGLLGAKALLLTNAAGGINYDFSPGDFMLITDQIASFVPSPLVGPNPSSLGPRFPDMTAIYDRDLREAIRSAAGQENIPLREGVYIQLSGPQYESPAEIELCRLLKADAVGMSTACEAIAANHMGMRVCGISCISNLASGMGEQPLSAQEVENTAGRVAPQFRRLVRRAVSEIGGRLQSV